MYSIGNRESEKQKIYAATIGCGRMGAFVDAKVMQQTPAFWQPLAHLAALSALPQVTSVACCDVSKEAREKARIQYGIDKAYEDFQRLILIEDINLLTIATRTPQKTEIILKAIQKRIPAIHIEKPLCNSALDLKRIASAITQYDTLVTYGCIRRFLMPYMKALELSKSEMPNEVRDIHIEMGKAPIMWSHIHAIELVLFFADGAKPTHVSALFDDLELDTEYPFTITNDPCLKFASIIFESGLVGRIGRTSGDSVTLSGDNFRVEVFADGRELHKSKRSSGKLYQNKTLITYDDENSLGGSAAPLSRLADALVGDEVAVAAVRKARTCMLQSQTLMFDMLHSHMSNSALVSVDSHPDEMVIKGMTNGKPA